MTNCKKGVKSIVVRSLHSYVAVVGDDCLERLVFEVAFALSWEVLVVHSCSVVVVVGYYYC
jgi:hypothetical protein